MILGKHKLSIFLFSLLLLLSLCVTIPWWGLKILRNHPGSNSFITSPPPQSHRGVTARTTLVGLWRVGRLCVPLPHFARGECSPATAAVPYSRPTPSHWAHICSWQSTRSRLLWTFAFF